MSELVSFSQGSNDADVDHKGETSTWTAKAHISSAMAFYAQFFGEKTRRTRALGKRQLSKALGLSVRVSAPARTRVNTLKQQQRAWRVSTESMVARMKDQQSRGETTLLTETGNIVDGSVDPATSLKGKQRVMHQGIQAHRKAMQSQHEKGEVENGIARPPLPYKFAVGQPRAKSAKAKAQAKKAAVVASVESQRISYPAVILNSCHTLVL